MRGSDKAVCLETRAACRSLPSINYQYFPVARCVRNYTTRHSLSTELLIISQKCGLGWLFTRARLRKPSRLTAHGFRDISILRECQEILGPDSRQNVEYGRNGSPG